MTGIDWQKYCFKWCGHIEKQLSSSKIKQKFRRWRGTELLMSTSELNVNTPFSDSRVYIALEQDGMNALLLIAPLRFMKNNAVLLKDLLDNCRPFLLTTSAYLSKLDCRLRLLSAFTPTKSKTNFSHFSTKSLTFRTSNSIAPASLSPHYADYIPKDISLNLSLQTHDQQENRIHYVCGYSCGLRNNFPLTGQNGLDLGSRKDHNNKFTGAAGPTLQEQD